MDILHVYDIVSLYVDVCAMPYFMIRGSGLTVEGNCYNRGIIDCYKYLVKRYDVMDSDIPDYSEIIIIYV